MQALHEAGAIVLPASPGFYHNAKTIDDLVNFVVARICDQLNIANELVCRWGIEIYCGDTSYLPGTRSILTYHFCDAIRNYVRINSCSY